MGAIYELGAICALQESLSGIDFTRLQHRVGASAGGFVAGGWAIGIMPQQLFTLFIEERKRQLGATDEVWLLTPAFTKFISGSMLLPDSGLVHFFSKPGNNNDFRQLSACSQLTCTFGSTVLCALRCYKSLGQKSCTARFAPSMASQFRQPNAQLIHGQARKSRLTLVATQLDSSKTISFAHHEWDRLSISKAVHASSAFSQPFSPVVIGGQRDRDADLPAALSQTFRLMIHLRQVLAQKSYEQTLPNTEIVPIQPNQHDPGSNPANTFGNDRLKELTSQKTLQLLYSRQPCLNTKRRYRSITLNHATLSDNRRRLRLPMRSPTRAVQALASRHNILKNLNQVEKSASTEGQPAW
jgi:hypothetical protein